MKGPKPDRKSAMGKIKWMSYNAQTGEPYASYPRFFDSEGRFRILRYYEFPRPNKEFEDVYEVKKKFETENWYSNFSYELDYIEERMGKKKHETRSVLNDLEAKVLVRLHEFLDKKGTVVAGFIEQEFDCKPTVATRLARLMNAKIGKGEYGV